MVAVVVTLGATLRAAATAAAAARLGRLLGGDGRSQLSGDLGLLGLEPFGGGRRLVQRTGMRGLVRPVLLLAGLQLRLL